MHGRHYVRNSNHDQPHHRQVDGRLLQPGTLSNIALFVLFFNFKSNLQLFQGIYDLHIEVWGVPLLPWDPPEMTDNIIAR